MDEVYRKSESVLGLFIDAKSDDHQYTSLVANRAQITLYIVIIVVIISTYSTKNSIVPSGTTAQITGIC